MILVCPACKANFKIPDGAIPAQGRKVRCAQCKNAWHAMPTQIIKAPPVAPAPRPASPAARPAMPPSPAAGGFDMDMDAGLAARTAQLRRTLDTPPPPVAPPPKSVLRDPFDEDDMAKPAARKVPIDEDTLGSGDDFGIGAALRAKFSDSEDKFDDRADRGDDDDLDHDHDDDHESEDGEAYDEDDFLARRRADQRRQGEREARSRQRKLITVGWALLMIFILSVLYVVVFKKDVLQEKWPASSVLYGMFEGASDIERYKPAEGETLTPPITETEVYVRALLEQSTVEERNGEAALILRGYVENTGNRAANVPKVEATILDGRGKVLDSWTFDPPGLVLRRGARLKFEESRSPIPIGAAKAEVKAVEGSKSSTEAEAP